MLKVPLAKQKNKLGCGPTTLGMVLNYFGEKVSEEKILDALGGVFENKETGHAGTFATENALYAKSLGYKVICTTYNLELFKPSLTDASKEDLRKYIIKTLKKKNHTVNRRILKTYLQLLDSGVDLRIKMPSFNEYKRYLDKKIPVIIAVNSKILRESDNSQTWTGHYIALIGYKNNCFFYNDPLDAKVHRIKDEKLWLALSNNVIRSSAYMVVVKK